MDELMDYDVTKTPPLFSLENNANLCYLNSLIQSLLSCTAFNEAIANEKADNISKNRVIQEFIDLLNKPDNKSPQKINVYSLYKLFMALLAAKNKSIHLQYGRQEDAFEGLQLILDSIGAKYDILFHNRYKTQIHCRRCNYDSKPGAEEPCEIAIKISDRLNTKKSIEEHIKRYLEFPEDYTCEKCRVKNDKKTRENIYRVYTLTRVSEIIILLFKKYTYKTNVYFPSSLDFRGVNNTHLHYKIVAQIEHYGTMNGGHYTARCLRPKPAGFHEQRIEYARQILQTNNDPQRIKTVKTALAHDLTCVNNRDNLGVFLFNDTHISYMPDGFKPTPETYMVFYHLFPI